MSRAVIAREFRPESHKLELHDPGPPAPDQVRIAVRAAGISFVDVLTAAGQYQVKPPLPFIPGSECAGIVEAVGNGVKGFAPGDKICGSGWCGIFAEHVNLTARSVRVMPECLSFEEAAVLPTSYYTAYHALVDRAQLKAGETLLVLGAGGATGYAAVQIGKTLGARVIASASSTAKRALAIAGCADVAVDARAEDWRDQVRAANDGKGVDVVFDPVGGDAIDRVFRSLGWNGRHLIVGFPAGIAALRTNLPLLKGSSLVGVDIRQFGIFESEKSQANQQAVFELAEQGVLKPVIAKSYQLEDFVSAMNDSASGRSAGRIVLLMNGGVSAC
jgi:NADPH:quinone reductase